MGKREGVGKGVSAEVGESIGERENATENVGSIELERIDRLGDGEEVPGAIGNALEESAGIKEKDADPLPPPLALNVESTLQLKLPLPLPLLVPLKELRVGVGEGVDCGLRGPHRVARAVLVFLSCMPL